MSKAWLYYIIINTMWDASKKVHFSQVYFFVTVIKTDMDTATDRQISEKLLGFEMGSSASELRNKNSTFQ